MKLMLDILTMDGAGKTTRNKTNFPSGFEDRLPMLITGPNPHRLRL